MHALRAGPHAARVLGRPATGHVAVGVRGGAYLRLDDELVLVAGPRAHIGPLSLVVAGLPPQGWPPGTPAALAAGSLRLGDAVIALDRMCVQASDPPGPLRLGWQAAMRAAQDAVDPPPAALGAGLDALARGDDEGALRLLAGVGEGLTPAGDDALAGAAAWRHAEGAPVAWSAHPAAARCGVIGLAYLACAQRGELPAPAAAVRAAVRAARAEQARRRAGALRAWGASSGAALLWGMAAAAGMPAGSG